MRAIKAALVVAIVFLSLVSTPLQAQAASRAFHVSPTGSDSAAGTQSAPWRSVARGLKALRAGDTLYLRGGTYTERVGGRGSGGFIAVSPGSPSQRVTVQAYPGERPVIRGLLWVSNADYWTFNGVNVTWSETNATNEHMVRFRDGRGWEFENAEVWGARSYANINVFGSKPGLPSDWAIRNNCIHDNYGDPDHGGAKDQLLYVNTGVISGPGVIEGNLLFNAPRGKGIKITGPDPGTGSAHVAIRYNTVVKSNKPNVVVGWASTDTEVYRNIIVGTKDMSLIRGYQLEGGGNWARDNIGFDGPRMLHSDRGYPETIGDKGGNTMVNPDFDNTSGCAGFNPRNTVAGDYGHTAAPGHTIPTPEPEPQPEPMPEPAPKISGAVDFIGSRSAANKGGMTLVIDSPAAAPGDVLLATVDVRGKPNVTAPAGWRLVRTDTHHSTMRKATYWHVVGSSEPRAYTWQLDRKQSAVGAILAYRGVSTTAPIEAAGGRLTDRSKEVLAPTLNTSTPNSRVVGLFASVGMVEITAPDSMTKSTEQSADSTLRYLMTASTADRLQKDAGSTGSHAATVSHARDGIGQLIVLRPIGH